MSFSNNYSYQLLFLCIHVVRFCSHCCCLVFIRAELMKKSNGVYFPEEVISSLSTVICLDVYTVS